MAKVIAVLDACVLHSAPLRDLFVQLAVDGVYESTATSQKSTKNTIRVSRYFI